MKHHSGQPFVSHHLDPGLGLRRQMLVSSLFKYVAEVQEIKDGYAFRFQQSRLLVRRMAAYILFEGLNSPQLTFEIIAEPNGTLWLQVRKPGSEIEEIRAGQAPVNAQELSPL